MKNRLPLLLLSLASLLLASLAILSCDSANPVAPTGSTLTVTANPTLITLNGTSTITVTGFRPDGNPLNPGTQVNLSSSIGTLGATIVEIQNGRATTTLRPDGRTGAATVTAKLPGGDTEASVEVQIGATDETKPKLLVNANPETINLNQSSTISFQARNADDSNFGQGGRIRLRTTLGTLDDENLVTDADGEAETTLRPGSEVGTATVSATIEESDEATVEVQFGATADTKPSLLLTASPTNIGINQTSTISILVRNADGTTFDGSGNIRLRTTLGTLNREQAPVSNGEASARLTNDEGLSGTARVTATFQSSDEATIDIELEVPILTISATPADISLNEMSMISVRVRNPDGSPVANQAVRLRTTRGSLSSTNPRTDDSGEASAELTATEVGTATVRASVGASDEVTTDVVFGERPEDRPTLTLSANPGQINIEQEATITAQARNADGTPLVGETVSLRSTLGQLQITGDGKTDSAGQVEATLSPEDISGTATIIGSVGSSAEVTQDVTFLRTVLTVNANPAVIDTGETSEITVLVRDERNISLDEGSYDVQLTANLGTLDSTTITTMNGSATTTYRAGSRPGTEQITAFLGNADTGIESITIRDVPAGITLDVAPAEFTPSTAGTTLTLTVRVTNAQGEPLGNEIVSFVVSDGVAGTLTPAGGPVTDSDGLATATLTITETGIPGGVTSFTITAIVRDLESSPSPITVTGGAP